MFSQYHMGVERFFSPPKWMVNIMENPMKMDDLGVKPPIFGILRSTPKVYPDFGVI